MNFENLNVEEKWKNFRKSVQGYLYGVYGNMRKFGRSIFIII